MAAISYSGYDLFVAACTGVPVFRIHICNKAGKY